VFDVIKEIFFDYSKDSKTKGAPQEGISIPVLAESFPS